MTNLERAAKENREAAVKAMKHPLWMTLYDPLTQGFNGDDVTRFIDEAVKIVDVLANPHGVAQAVFDLAANEMLERLNVALAKDTPDDLDTPPAMPVDVGAEAI